MLGQRVEQAVIVTQTELRADQTATQLAFFNPDGTPFDFTPTETQTGANIVLTGFATGAAITAIAATDTVNAALAKLQNRIAALEAA